MPRYTIYLLLIILLITGFQHTSGQTPSVIGQTVGHYQKFPWAGGLNSCQFGSIDIDLDGLNDIVIFDRHGNRIIPFLNTGTRENPDYTFHPEFSVRFPDLHDWVIFCDFNCDGKMDIFTYSLGGIRVFVNESNTRLSFHLVTDLLLSYYYSGYVGILVTQGDYPALSDIDNDGDLDLLTFFGLGSYVEYHKNLSIEKYGNCDSLDFSLADKCWGDFKESVESNKIELNITCPYKHTLIPGSCNTYPDPKHTGSTLLATDLDGNGLKDLVIGDVDFPGLISLKNDGTPDSAHIVSQDTLFPSNPVPVRLFSFPAMGFCDLDADGIKDLLVSPFDPSLLTAENYHSVWYYHNEGSDMAPDFHFISDQLFQDEMIDAGSNSFPSLFDIDGDGLQDLLIGNYGYYDSSFYNNGSLNSIFTSKIAFYKNSGSQYNPEFTFITNDLGSLSSLHLTGLFPTFSDLDGDGDIDMINGTSTGTLIYSENLAGPGQTPVFNTPTLNYNNIDVGDFSTPQLADIDSDGHPDLVIGEKNGNLNYYHNDGTGSAFVFRLQTDSLGKINVTDPSLSYFGYSTPCIFTDISGKLSLIVGSEQGTLYYYPDFEDQLSGKFLPSDSLFTIITGYPINLYGGIRSCACIARLTDNTFLDLIEGNYSGGLNYFSKRSTPHFLPPDETNSTGIKIFPIPADKSITIRINTSQQENHLQFTIVNTFGQKIIEKSLKNVNVTTINTSYLPAGIYLVLINNCTNQNCNTFLAKKILISH